MTERPHPDPIAQASVVNLRLIATVLLVAVAVIATGGLVALSIEGLRNKSAFNKATIALQQASTATTALEQQQAALRRSLVQGCERLNIQRASVNTANTATYSLYRVVLLETKATPTDPARRNERQRFLVALQADLDSLTWTALTNCSLAVATSGAAYKPEPPIPFTMRQPPASALNSVNAALPQPRDSVS